MFENKLNHNQEIMPDFGQNGSWNTGQGNLSLSLNGSLMMCPTYTDVAPESVAFSMSPIVYPQIQKTGSFFPMYGEGRETPQIEQILKTAQMGSGIYSHPFHVTGMTPILKDTSYPISQSVITQNPLPLEAESRRYDAFRKPNGFFEEVIGNISQKVHINSENNFVSTKEREKIKLDIDPIDFQAMLDQGMNEKQILKAHQEYDEKLIKILSNELRDAEIENDIDHLYVDTQGLLSYGIGRNVNNWSNFKSVPWIDPLTKVPLTPQQIFYNYQKACAIRDRIIAEAEKSKADGKFTGKSNFKVNLKASAQKHLFEHLGTTDKEERLQFVKNFLRESTLPDIKKIMRSYNRPFYSEPLSAQLGLLDIGYNSGASNFRMRTLEYYNDKPDEIPDKSHDWPNLTKAFLDYNYREMAKEANRKGISLTRNDRTKKRFENAAMEYRYGVRGGPRYGDLLFDVVLND